MWYHTVLVFLSQFDLYHLALYPPSPSMLLQMAKKKKNYGWVIFYYVVNHIFIHSSLDRHLGCFYILEIVSKSALSFGVHISFSISGFWFFFFFKYIARSIVAGSYGSSIFRFLRNLHTVFHRGCTNVHHTDSVQVFPFLHILANIYYLVFFFSFPL